MADAHLPALGGAAQVAKARKRGPPSQQRRNEDTAAQAAGGPRTKKPKAAAVLDECAVVISSVMKTGMVLARAKLAESASGIIAARDRQAALVGKGDYREAEKVAREASVGTLATKQMPKRKESSESAVQFKASFRTWMRSTLGAKVGARPVHTRAARVRRE